MRILLLESSGPVGTVGLALGERLVAERRLDEARRHCRDLAPATEAILLEQEVRPDQVDAVVVSLGPGSYTGLRVGVMSAKAFAYAVGCRLVGVPTFAAVASAASASFPRLEVIEDAQQERVYTQRFVAGKDGLPVESGPLRILDHGDWLAQLDPSFALAGPGLKKKREALPSRQPILPIGFWRPTLLALLRLGLARLERNQTDDPMSLEPIYGRPSAAERQWTALGR